MTTQDEKGLGSFDEETAALIKAAVELERARIAIWMRSQNAAQECGPFSLHNASHAVEDGSYDDTRKAGQP